MSHQPNYIFDLFGTIVTNKGVDELLANLIPGVVPEKFLHFINTTDFGSTHRATQEIAAKYDIPCDRFLTRKVKDEVASWMNNQSFEPGALEVLTELRNRGARLALLSNIPNYLDDIVDMFQLDDHFDHVFLSHKMGFDKHNPKAYHAVVTEMQFYPEDTFFIGNERENDVEYPSIHGMRGVLYDPKKNHTDYPYRISDLRDVLDLAIA